MRLINARTDQPVVSTVEMANTRATRRKGLLGRDSLAPGSALLLTPCNAVHTIGMRFTIDVVFVDSRGYVRKIVHRMAPWRMAVSPFSRSTIEFPAGELDVDVVRVGDRLYLAPEAGMNPTDMSAFLRAQPRGFAMPGGRSVPARASR